MRRAGRGVGAALLRCALGALAGLLASTALAFLGGAIARLAWGGRGRLSGRRPLVEGVHDLVDLAARGLLAGLVVALGALAVGVLLLLAGRGGGVGRGSPLDLGGAHASERVGGAFGRFGGIDEVFDGDGDLLALGRGVALGRVEFDEDELGEDLPVDDDASALSSADACLAGGSS